MGKIELEKIGLIELIEENNELVYSDNELKIDNNETIEFDLHFEKVDENNLKKVNNVVLNLNTILEKSENLILEDYKNKGEVEYYINEWKDEIFPQIMTDEEFKKFISDTTTSDSQEKRLLSKLRIVRIGIYANSEDSFLTLDYAFGKDVESGFRDDMLVVRMNSKFDLVHITNEG